MNGLPLESFFFKTLLSGSSHEHAEDRWCKKGLTENKFMFIEEYFDQVSSLSDVESGRITYITDYVTKKSFGKIFLCGYFSAKVWILAFD